MAEMLVKVWACNICGYEWLAKTKPARCASHKCRSRKWMPKEQIIQGSQYQACYELALGQAFHAAYKCDVCGHIWLAKEQRKPERCAAAKCKSRKWNAGAATVKTVLKFHAGKKVKEYT